MGGNIGGLFSVNATTGVVSISRRQLPVGDHFGRARLTVKASAESEEGNGPSSAAAAVCVVVVQGGERAPRERWLRSIKVLAPDKTSTEFIWETTPKIPSFSRYKPSQKGGGLPPLYIGEKAMQ